MSVFFTITSPAPGRNKYPINMCWIELLNLKSPKCTCTFFSLVAYESTLKKKKKMTSYLLASEST